MDGPQEEAPGTNVTHNDAMPFVAIVAEGVMTRGPYSTHRPSMARSQGMLAGPAVIMVTIHGQDSCTSVAQRDTCG